MPPGSTPARTSIRASAGSRGGDEPAAPPVPQAPRFTDAVRAQRDPIPQRRVEPEAKLSGLEQRILSFEARWWRASGAKTQAIADELELTPEQYYQHLARLVDHPEAAKEQPAVIRRLRAARDHRKGAR